MLALRTGHSGTIATVVNVRRKSPLVACWDQTPEDTANRAIKFRFLVAKLTRRYAPAHEETTTAEFAQTTQPVP